MSAQQKFFAAAALLCVWGIFAAAGLTPVQDYVAAIRDILIGLGVFSSTMADPKKV